MASVPLLAPLALELAAHRERQAKLGFDRIKPEALIFQTLTGRPQSRRNVHRAVSSAARWIGLQPEGSEPVTPHDLRPSAAAYAYSVGMNHAEVCRFLLHANPSITLSTYSGLTDSQAAAIGDKLAAGIGGAP